MKKLKLSPISIQSFVTSLSSEDKKKLKGGDTDPLNCYTIVTCPETVCAPTDETCNPICNTCTCYTCYPCTDTCECNTPQTYCPMC